MASDSSLSFDDVLAELRHEPHNSDVVSDLSFFNDNGDVVQHRQRRADAGGNVVDGDVIVEVVGIR